MAPPLHDRDLHATPPATRDPGMVPEPFAPRDIILENRIHCGDKTEIYRAHGPRRRPLIVKCLSPAHQTIANANRLKHEYDLLKQLDCRGVRRALAFTEIDQKTSVIFEDVNGVPLPEALKSRRFVLSRILHIFAQWARALAELHVRGIVHRNVSPLHLLVEPSTDTVFLIDFGDAARLLPTQSASHSMPKLDSATTCDVPGRSHGPVDERADLYALGASMYEILVGKPPGDIGTTKTHGETNLELNPIAPHLLDAQIPVIVSNLVLKLLEISPNTRYQSALAVAQDLERMLELLKQKDFTALANMPLGRTDVPVRLAISTQLYGRDTERKSIRDHWQHVRSGGSSFVLLQGESGIGKSSLIETILKEDLGDQATIARASLHAASRNLPLDGILQVAQSLVTTPAFANESTRQALKRTLASSLETSASILAELIPELSSVLGSCENHLDLPPDESRNRLVTAVVKFFHAFSTREHPLVLFFDDLHWADAASVEIISQLACGSHAHHILVLATCRTDLVTDNAALAKALPTWPTQVPYFRSLALPCLSEAHLTQLCIDSFRLTSTEAERLAVEIHRQTDGNPYEAHCCIRGLYRNSTLRFDLAKGCWQFEPQTASSLLAAGSRITSREQLVHSLPRSTQLTLAYASLYAHHFDLDTLIDLTNSSLETLQADLERAVSDGIIRVISASGVPARKALYGFCHAQTLTICSSLLDHATTLKLKLKLARTLLGQHQSLLGLNWQVAASIFQALAHLHDANALLTDSEECLLLAILCSEAGARTQAIGAWDIGTRLFRQGRCLLSRGSTVTDRDMMRRLYRGEAICASLCGDESGDLSFDALLSDAQSPSEIADVHLQRCLLASSRGDLDGAIRYGLAGLETLGIRVGSKTPGIIRAFFMVRSRQQQLLRTNLNQLIDLPMMQTDRDLMIMKLLTHTIIASLTQRPNLASILVCLQVDHILGAGHSIYSASAVLLLALVANNLTILSTLKVCDVDQISTLLSIYRKLDGSYSDASQHLRNESIYRIVAATCLQNPRHRSLIAPPSFGQLLEIGANEMAMTTNFLSMDQAFCCGENILETRLKSETWREFVSRHHTPQQRRYADVFQETITAMAGSDATSALKVISAFDHATLLTETNRSHRTDLLQHQGQMLTLLGQHDKAYLCFVDALWRSQIRILAAGFKISFLLLLLNVNIARLYSKSPWSRRLAMRLWMAWSTRITRVLSTISPEYHRSKHCAIAGLHEIILGRQPSRGYEKLENALNLARKHGLTSDEAIIAEHLAHLALDRKLNHLAIGPLHVARAAYQRWGIMVKVNQIDTIIDSIDLPGEQRFSSSQRDLTAQSKVASPVQATFLDAAMSLSSALTLTDLKQTLLNLLSETMGARVAALLWYESGSADPRIIAYRYHDGQLVMKSQAVSEDLLAVSAIEFVDRHRTSLVIGDARLNEDWSDNQTIQARGIKSLLCVPIFKSSNLRGILYLENDLSAYAFTPEHLSVLNVISAQTAISIDHAMLYDKLALTLAQEQTARFQDRAAHNRDLKMQQLQRNLAPTSELVQRSLITMHPADARYESASFFEAGTNTSSHWLSTYYAASQDRLFICLGDVKGHELSFPLVIAGVAGTAASVMAKLKTNHDLDLRSSLVCLVDAMNIAVKSVGDASGQLMTMTLLAIDLKSGHGVYVNAGHHSVFWYAAQPKTLLATGMPLGFRDGSPAKLFGSLDFQLARGDTLLLYSTGLLDHRRQDGTRISQNYLRQLGDKSHDPSQLVGNLRDTVKENQHHEENAGAACLAVRWLGPNL